MLSIEEQKELDHEILHYERRQGACIDALRILQRHRRWISDESIRDIAEYLGMSADEIDGVATFYNLIFRKPVGAHVIYLCDSVSCWINGCNDLQAEITRRLDIRPGETTSDGTFTLVPIQCLGTCDHAPALMIDDTLYSNLTVESLADILSNYEKGTKDNGITSHREYSPG